jgi:hypothetical protein
MQYLRWRRLSDQHGSEGPSVRKRTVKNVNTDDFPTILPWPGCVTLPFEGSASISVQGFRSRADRTAENAALFDLLARLFWDRHGTVPRLPV